MDLKLSEAARLLGKSERQVRYLLRQGKISGQKGPNGRWSIRREDLPLSEGQERAGRQKTERAARLAEEILRNPAETKKSHSVTELRAYREGAPLFRELQEAVGREHPAVPLLREALMLLACGYHEFQGSEKAVHYGEARRCASRAVMTLLLDDEEKHGELVERLETVFLPSVGGLIHQAERRGRRDRSR